MWMKSLLQQTVDPSYQAVCQTCHFAVACATAQLLVTLGADGRYGLLVVFVFAGLKEFVWDTLIPVSWGGENDTWLSSLLDWTFYMIGTLVCLIVFYLTDKL